VYEVHMVLSQYAVRPVSREFVMCRFSGKEML
jgi:hypothetical protein